MPLLWLVNEAARAEVKGIIAYAMGTEPKGSNRLVKIAVAMATKEIWLRGQDLATAVAGQ